MAKKKRMYIFISHSSHDKPFVRQLANSLAFYGVPIFLDEREIKVGDNIPERVFKALENATHVIYVISKKSVSSKWVTEELTVAKMRQLDKKGCLILPLLLEDVPPPSSIVHLKYADFRSWQVKEAYLKAFQELLESINLKAEYLTTSELHFLQHHFTELIKTKEVADTACQLFFQLERLYFLLNRDAWEVQRWFIDTMNHSRNGIPLEEAVSILKADFHNNSSAHKLSRLLELCEKVISDYSFMGSSSSDESLVYQRTWSAENNAQELSAFVLSIILELQNVPVPNRL